MNQTDRFFDRRPDEIGPGRAATPRPQPLSFCAAWWPAKMTKANGGSNSGTAASRPGGKFGGSGGGGRQGKFAKLKPPSSSAGGEAASSSADAAAAAAAKASKKRVRTERQAKLFADLDEAEATVLGMIALASETASALSDLASGREAASATGGGGDDADTDTAAAAKKIAELAKKNGEDYLDKVARVHALLSPHAEKVVAYSNHEVDTAEASASAAAAAAAAVDDETAKSEAQAREKKNNMYAAKVEMRLAIERRDVLKEFLRLEKEELGMEDDDDDDNNNINEEDDDEQKQAATRSGETNGGDATATKNTGTRKGKRRRAG